jgi:hypothetical protein
MIEQDGRGDAAGELTHEELAHHHAQALPVREAMSHGGFDPTGWENFAMPVNEALALNYESTDSVAFAEADQTVIVGPLGDAAEEG